MAPGRKRDFGKEKKKNGGFSVGNKKGPTKSAQNVSTKKAKDKSVHKKKLKEQTSKWMEDVNESFSDLHQKLADKNSKKEIDKATDRKSVKEVDTQKLKSDVTEAEISNTITNMANLLEQS